MGNPSIRSAVVRTVQTLRKGWKRQRRHRQKKSRGEDAVTSSRAECASTHSELTPRQPAQSSPTFPFVWWKFQPPTIPPRAVRLAAVCLHHVAHSAAAAPSERCMSQSPGPRVGSVGQIDPIAAQACPSPPSPVVTIIIRTIPLGRERRQWEAEGKPSSETLGIRVP